MPVEPPDAAISEAVLTLNRLGQIVDLGGRLHLGIDLVHLKIRDGRLVAVLNGHVFTWSEIRRALKPKPRRSYPPVGYLDDGTPHWRHPIPKPADLERQAWVNLHRSGS
jgi:hypothetical protein